MWGRPGGAPATSVLSAALSHWFNLSAHYPPPSGRGADKCTLGPQAKLIHLPSFSWGSEVAAAQRQGDDSQRLCETELRKRDGKRKQQTDIKCVSVWGGGSGWGHQQKKVLLALFHIHISFHFCFPPLLSHYSTNTPSLKTAIKTCTHSPTKSQVGN